MATPSDDLSKDQQKREASSVEEAHILSVLSKCKIVRNTDDGLSEKIKTCLLELDKIQETSLVLQSLKFADHVTICLDPNASNLSRIAKSDALGWYNRQEGELLIGAAELKTNEKYFMGVFAHELTHWSMQTIFKNQGLPYFQSDPNREKEDEFEKIVTNVKDLNSNNVLNPVITSVFRDYNQGNWHQELIVRVPHLMAQNGLEDATEILSLHQPTRDLLDFYRQYVMVEIRKFIADGDLEKSRETVVKLNSKLGLLDLYRMYKFQFETSVDIDLSENTSLWVYSSPHPYLSFLKIAWTLNCKETTELFHGNNVFCDFDAFANNFSEVMSVVRKLDECKTLFIVCPEIAAEASYKTLFEYLEEVLAVKSNKKVVLTVKNKMLSLTKKQLKGIAGVNSKCVSMKKIEFSDLQEESQELVLNSPVTVQERDVELNELLEKEEFHLCDGNLIERLIRCEKAKARVIVGDTNLSHGDCAAGFVSFYENLKIQRLIDLICECTDDGKECEFALVLVGKLENYPDRLEEMLCDRLGCDDLNEIHVTSTDALLDKDFQNDAVYRILLLTSEADWDYSRLLTEFHQSCSFELCYIVKVASKKVIYSDQIFYPDLVFHRNLEMVKANSLKMVDGGTDKCMDQNDFMKNIISGTERVIIISDNAGAGKSQFLNLIYNTIQKCWVIKCSLKSCVSFIDEHTLSTDLDQEDAMNFILRLGRISDQFAEDLLNFKMTNASQYPVLLLLDGMDEVTSSDRSTASKNKEKLASLIQFLKKHTFLKVLIATRPESESELSHLSCPVYAFTEISLKESESYLTNLCFVRSRLFPKSGISKESATAFVQKYIGRYRIDTHVSPYFLKIPLHVSMLSEIIVESMKDDTFNSNVVDSDGSLIPDQLYSEFINNKYRIYFKEKKNIAVDERLKENCNSAFEMLAFFSLFSREGFSKLLFKKNCFSKSSLFVCESSGKVTLNYDKVSLYFDIGIISSSPGFYVDFVHQTFAEYFVSRLFISWAQDELMTERWVIDVIYQPHRTLSFFESMFKHVTFSDDIIKRHGDLMVSLDTEKTVYALRYHMWFDRLNVLNYIFKCWKRVDKFHIILDPNTYKNERDYPLFFASTMSSDRVLERVLKEDFDINYKFKNSYVITSLFRRGNVPMLKSFVENGLLKNDVLKEVGSSVVYEAAASGEIDLVEWLESLGYDVLQEKTIAAAIDHGKLDMARWLKNRGVSIFFRRGVLERSAIHSAVERRQFHLVKWLLDEGLDINEGDINGRTPLHCAITFGLLDMVQFLVTAGADIHVRTKRGKNALHCAALDSLTRVDMFKWLVEHGSRVDDKTPSGCSAVHLALKYKSNTDVVEWLLDQTEDLQATDGKGYGYVHCAAANNERFHLSLVLSKNCDVNLRAMGKTAAHIAIDSMGPLLPYDVETEDEIEDYCRFMVEPFKLLVLKMMETNQSILEELLSYAKEKHLSKTYLILDIAIEWMETERQKLLKLL